MYEIAAYINKAISWIIVGTAAVIPLLFLPHTSEFFEMPKIIFLAGIVIILLILWAINWIIQGRVVITKTPLDIPLLLLLLIIIASTFLSDSRYVSIYGNFPRLHGSMISWVAYILFYFIAVSNLKTQNQIRSVFYALIGSSVVVAVVSLASYFGFYLPFAFAKHPAFTPTGSAFSTAALLILLLPFPLLSIVSSNKLLPLPFAIFTSALFLITIALIGTPALIIISLLALGAVGFVSKQKALTRILPLLLIPVILAGVLFVGGFIKTDKNILYTKRIEYGNLKEVQLPFNHSWKVAASAFRDEPFKGSGPATFLFNYTAYKPAEVNLTKYWNLRFDTAFNEYLQVLGTLGLLGFLSLSFFSVVILIMGWNLVNRKEHSTILSDVFVPALSISSLLIVGVMLVHVTTPVMIVAALLILAMLMSVHRSITGKVEELTLGIRASRVSGSSDANLVLAVILFIPILLFAIFSAWFGVKGILGEYHHRKAFTIPVSNGLGIYNELRESTVNNPFIDIYHLDLAQVNFALANSIAAAKGPTESSPSGSLTDVDKANIQQLISQSIQEARIATALSPKSAQNWEVLAAIYRQISGVAQDALTFSLDAYGRSIQQDPMNPQLRLNVGGVYYSIKNYDLAIRFFTDAVNLKPDFANGYYNLAVALREKGDLQGAALSTEQVIRLVDPKSEDYKTASRLLNELKDSLSKATAESDNKQVAGQSTTVPPAAEKTSALENKDLPKLNVLEEEKPEKIATPEAVKASPSPR